MLDKQRCYAFTQAKKRVVVGLLAALLLFTMQLMNISYAYESTTIPLGKPMLFKNITSVTTDSNGTVYASDVQDSYTSLIHKIDTNGIYLGTIKLNFSTGALVVDTLGNLYAYNGKVIVKFTAKGELIKRWPVKVTPSSYPLKLFIDSKNNLYFSGTKAIVIYNSEGQLINRITHITEKSSTISFKSEQIIAINSHDQILVNNSGFLYQINTSGKNIKTKLDLKNFSTDKEQQSILAYDDENRLYFMSSACQCLQVYNSEGNFIKSIGSAGNSKGQFMPDVRLNISKKNHNLILTDYLSTRVQAINYDMATLWSIGDELGRIGPVYYTDFVLDSMSNIYILDTTYYRVNKFSPSGILLNTWSSLGKDDNELDRFSKITIDHNDNIYIQDYIGSESEERRIRVFSSDGVFLKNYPYSWPNFDKQNNHYHLIEEDEAYSIKKYDTNDQLLKKIKLSLKPVHDYYNRLSVNNNFLIDSSGSFYISDISTYKVSTIDSSVTKYAATDGQAMQSTTRKSLTPIGLDSHDQFYCNDGSSYLDIFDNKLNFSGRFLNKSINNSRVHLARNDQIYVIKSSEDIAAALSLEIVDPPSTLAPPPLTSITKRGTKGAVTLKWQDSSNDETGFNIYRCKMDYNSSVDFTCSNYQLVATVAANTQKIRLASPADFQTGDTYEYRITAIKGQEESLAGKAQIVNYY